MTSTDRPEMESRPYEFLLHWNKKIYCSAAAVANQRLYGSRDAEFCVR